MEILKAVVRQFFYLLSFSVFLVCGKVHAQDSGTPPSILHQPQSRESCPEGVSAALLGDAAGTEPLGYQWRKQGIPLSGATNKVLAFYNLRFTNAGEYDFVVTNSYGSATSAVAKLAMTLQFNSLQQSRPFGITAFLPELDDSIFVCGEFSSLFGQTNWGLARLKPDGMIDDETFTSPLSRMTLSVPGSKCVTLLHDGKMLLGGDFMLPSPQRKYFVRLNHDGGWDSTYDPSADAKVYTCLLQPDGKVIIGGAFTNIAGQLSPRIARLNPDGSLDTNFVGWSSGLITALALQDDGKILVGGSFSTICGTNCSRLARLNPDGSFDATFSPTISDGSVSVIAVQRDGGILVGGSFTTISGRTQKYLARLMGANGALDATCRFQASESIVSILLQADQRILITTDKTCTRYYPNGSTDYTLSGILSLPSNSYGCGVALTRDGSILAESAGQWYANGQSRTGLTGYRNTEPGFQRLEFDGSCLNWVLDGTFPEPFAVEFDFSTNRADWVSLGTGKRVSSGWQTFNATIPDGAVIRARGTVATGRNNASSFFVEAAIGAPSITKQPKAQANSTGGVVQFSVTATGTGPLFYQWCKDGVPLTDKLVSEGNITGSTNATLRLSNLLQTNAGMFSVIVSNATGVLTSDVVRLTVLTPLEPDEFTLFSDRSSISTMAVQPDGKVILSGSFVINSEQFTLIRVNPDGSLDDSFQCWSQMAVKSFAIQNDDKIIIAGILENNGNRATLMRLNYDGTVDTTFLPYNSGVVSNVILQVNGKIIGGGSSTLLRFNSDGSVDSTFRGSANGTVNCIALQEDGKILIGGSFSSVSGVSWPRPLARLWTNGTLESTFSISFPSPSLIQSIALQRDGKILAGGSFTGVVAGAGTIDRTNIVRLFSNGNVDETFNGHFVSSNPSYSIRSILAQDDGSILIGGDGITRVDRYGSWEPSFKVQILAPVSQLAIGSDGKILVRGLFASVNWIPRLNITRLKYPQESTPNQIITDGQNIQWLRRETDSQLSAATFESSLNNVDWSFIGSGKRSPQGWEVASGALPANSRIRARGRVSGDNHSSWIVESVTGSPLLTSQSRNQVRPSGSRATLFVSAAGSTPMSYRWFKNGVPLDDSATTAGTSTAYLTISNIMGFDNGGYSAIISNDFGCITSTPSILTVQDPYIYCQPENLESRAGQDCEISVLISGSAPMICAWYKNGQLLENPEVLSDTWQRLVLRNTTGVDAGDYMLVASNNFGCATSKVATVTVIDPVITMPPSDQSVHVGNPATFQIRALGTALHYQWRKDGRPIPNATSTNLTISGEMCLDPAHFDVVVTGTYGSATSSVATLIVDKTSIDAMNPSPGNHVLTIALQKDSKIILGGDSVVFGDHLGNGLARLEPSGALDKGFNPNINGVIQCIAVQDDGKILAGGYLSNIWNQSCSHLVRLKSDGLVDPTFSTDADDIVYCMTALPGNKLLIGGKFNSVAGHSTKYVARLNGDGSVDPTFTSGAEYPVVVLGIQPSGKILAGGTGVIRLNADGSPDSTFGISGNFVSLLVMGDGRFIASGSSLIISDRDGQCSSISSPLPGISTMALQSNAKTIVGGYNFFKALDFNYQIDETFNPSCNGWVQSLAIQNDGAILISGSFSTLSDQPRAGLGRLTNTDPATQELVCDGRSVTWLRGGTSPYAWMASFELSTNGSNWTLLGQGTHIANGWQLSGVSVPTNALIRARGCVSGGGVSSWFVEATNRFTGVSQTSPSILTKNPLNMLTNHFGLRIVGNPGQTIVVEGSTNLVDWTAIETNIVGSNPLDWVDPTGLGSSSFYRLRLNQAK